MILRHHIPGVCDHLIDDLFIGGRGLSGEDFFHDHLEPEHLVTLAGVIKKVPEIFNS
jgi:hypothetical protein